MGALLSLPPPHLCKCPTIPRTTDSYRPRSSEALVLSKQLTSCRRWSIAVFVRPCLSHRQAGRLLEAKPPRSRTIGEQTPAGSCCHADSGWLALPQQPQNDIRSMLSLRRPGHRICCVPNTLSDFHNPEQCRIMPYRATAVGCWHERTASGRHLVFIVCVVRRAAFAPTTEDTRHTDT